MKAIALDTCVLGLLTHPNQSREANSCRSWLNDHLVGGHTILVPGIADYELRRELIRIESHDSLQRLDHLCRECTYLPIATNGMREAAALWARLRKQGTPTADDKALDGDVILGAHVIEYATENDVDVVVATQNVKHLSMMVPADRWDRI